MVSRRDRFIEASSERAAYSLDIPRRCFQQAHLLANAFWAGGLPSRAEIWFPPGRFRGVRLKDGNGDLTDALRTEVVVQP
jgi:hypothetical protein